MLPRPIFKPITGGGGGGTGVTLSVVCSPLYISRTTKFDSGTTSSGVASISGGVGPYTCIWTSDSSDIYPVSPTLTTTAFGWTDLEDGDVAFANVTCTALDSVGNTGYQIISVSVIRIDV